jgi:hypothetical protein
MNTDERLVEGMGEIRAKLGLRKHSNVPVDYVPFLSNQVSRHQALGVNAQLLPFLLKLRYAMGALRITRSLLYPKRISPQ